MYVWPTFQNQVFYEYHPKNVPKFLVPLDMNKSFLFLLPQQLEIVFYLMEKKPEHEFFLYNFIKENSVELKLRFSRDSSFGSVNNIFVKIHIPYACHYNPLLIRNRS